MCKILSYRLLLKCGGLLIVPLLAAGCKPEKIEPTPVPTVSVTSVSVSPLSAELTVGESVQLSATVSPDDASNKTITWSSSSSAVASVSVSGLVTAAGEGSATITASAGDKTAACIVTVKAAVVTVAVDGISLDKVEITLTEGEKEMLTAMVSPETATDKTVTWTSSDASVVTVDGGLVSAIKTGFASITAAAGDGGKTAVCQVRVVPGSMDGGHEGMGEDQWN